MKLFDQFNSELIKLIIYDEVTSKYFNLNYIKSSIIQNILILTI